MIIAGVDEAGRGCLAGPVVAAAVILSKDISSKKLRDSKQLTALQREEAFQTITKYCIWGVGECSAQEIDKLGIKKATEKAMNQAVENLSHIPDLLRIDGRDNFQFRLKAEQHIRGDQKFPEISAASIVAKVTRDKRMQLLDKKYPHYKFCEHKGYFTRLHQNILLEKGPCPLHRKTFNPLKTWLNQRSLFPDSSSWMSHY